MYKASDELKFMIKTNEGAIASQHKKVLKMVSDLTDRQNWTQGHIAEEVAHLSSMIAEQETLYKALHMLKKQEAESMVVSQEVSA